MTLRPDAINMIIAIIGTAATPLITALQKSALIGSRAVKFTPAPMKVAAAMVQ
jgi:hypothetical protein